MNAGGHGSEMSEVVEAVTLVDLTDGDHSGTWVRIIKDTNCLHLRRFLVYGQRRS